MPSDAEQDQRQGLGDEVAGHDRADRRQRLLLGDRAQLVLEREAHSPSWPSVGSVAAGPATGALAPVMRWRRRGGGLAADGAEAEGRRDWRRRTAPAAAGDPRRCGGRRHRARDRRRRGRGRGERGLLGADLDEALAGLGDVRLVALAVDDRLHLLGADVWRPRTGSSRRCRR